MIDSDLFDNLDGSVLLAINDTAVVNKTIDSIQYIISQSLPPFILTISCPYQQSPITLFEINEYLAHNGIVTNNSSTFQNLTPIMHWSQTQEGDSIPLFEKEQLLDSFLYQQDYTKIPFAVDSFMFPQSQGYSILQQAWMRWVVFILFQFLIS